MKKRIISLMLVSVMALSTLLVGCGSKPAEETAPAAEPAEQGEEPVAEEAEAPAVEAQTITFYGFSDWMDAEPYKEVYEAVKAAFEAENPGITVELQSDPWGDWEQKYKTMFASGNAADVFMVNNPDFPVFANSGNLLDLSEYAESGSFDKYFPGVLGMYEWQGKNMAVPFTTDCRIMWYNKEIFEEAGLDPEKAPTTWEELVAAAKQITEKTGKYGFGMDMGLKELPTASLYITSGSQLINVADDGTITPNVDTDEFRGYLKTLVDMKEAYEPDYPVLDMHDVAAQFAEGQFGIIIGNTLTATDIYDKDFWGQGLIPKMSSGSEEGSFGGGFGIAVNSETKAPKAATEFAQMLTDAQFNAGLISDLPATEEGLAKSELAADPNMGLYLEQIKYAKQSMPKTLYYAEIEAAAYDTVVSVVVGDEDIDAAIAALTEKIEGIAQK